MWETDNPYRQFGLTASSGSVNGQADSLHESGGFSSDAAPAVLDDGPQKLVSCRAVGNIFRCFPTGCLEQHQGTCEFPPLDVRRGFIE